MKRFLFLLLMVLQALSLDVLADSAVAVDSASTFGVADIRASRIVHHAGLPARPADVFAGVDMMNLFWVLEAGAHHISILDGDKLEPIHRFAARGVLHDEPKFTPDGRYVFFISRDGWISKYDLWNLKVVTEVRAGIDARNLAVSGDGKFIAVANALPRTLVLLDADLNLLRVHAVTNKERTATSRVLSVHDAAPRRSFVAVLQDVPEVWEISYDPTAPDVPIGVIHDFLYQEGAFIRGFLNPQRTRLSNPLEDVYFTQDYSELLSASPEAGKGLVVNLDARKKIASLAWPAANSAANSDKPRLGSGISWVWQGRRVMAAPHHNMGLLSLIDLESWKTVGEISMPGAGVYIHSHDSTPYAWADSINSPASDTLHVIDKRSLQRVAEVRADAGKTLGHVEFTRDGKYALASLSERRVEGGALIVFDATTFQEVKRIPMDKPAGKYNLFNTIHRAGGRSQ